MISKNMLCMSATAYKVAALDEDRKPTYNEGVILNNIYVIYNDAQRNGSNGKEPAAAASLYFDVANSSPITYEFTKGDKIEVNGNIYFVEKIAPYYNKNGLQHIEVSLN